MLVIESFSLRIAETDYQVEKSNELIKTKI